MSLRRQELLQVALVFMVTALATGVIYRRRANPIPVLLYEDLYADVYN